MKKFLPLLLLAMLSVVLVACGSDESTGTDGESTEKETIIIGIDDKFAPMGFRDENNEIVGFDIERYGKVEDFNFEFEPVEKLPVVLDILEKDVADKYTLSDKLWNYLQNYAAKHKEAGNGFGYGIAPLDGITRTISARYYKDGSEILIAQYGKNPRRLTPRECARLQGFPDSFKIPVSDTQAYKQFGNSVVVPLMEQVAKKVVAKLEEMDNTAHAKSEGKVS